MDKLQKIKVLIDKWGAKNEADMPKNTTSFNKVLKFISKEAYNLGTQSIQESHLEKDNHKIGIELESYCNVLLYRGLQKEHDTLLELVSRLK